MATSFALLAAAPADALRHIAVQEHVDGKVVDWLEQVSEEQYGK